MRNPLFVKAAFSLDEIETIWHTVTINYVYHMPDPCIAVLQYKPSMQFIEDEIIADAYDKKVVHFPILPNFAT